MDSAAQKRKNAANDHGPMAPCAHCKSRGRIESSQAISTALRRIYYACSNIECGHTWVAHLSFYGTISPPRKKMSRFDLNTLSDDALHVDPPPLGANMPPGEADASTA